MSATRREDVRHATNQFVAPGPLSGTTEGFMVVNLSAGGMSLLRVAPINRSVHDKKGLDQRFVWLSVPLSERGAPICALIEIMHRKRYGKLEMIGARFEEMSLDDRVLLVDYLAERDGLIEVEVGEADPDADLPELDLSGLDLAELDLCSLDLSDLDLSDFELAAVG